MKRANIVHNEADRRTITAKLLRKDFLATFGKATTENTEGHREEKKIEI
jgi:hypothetical protein